MSIRELICLNLIETAKQMTKGAGYHFDWGSFFRHLDPTDPDDVPAWAQMDRQEGKEQQNFPLLSRSMTVEIRGFHHVPDPNEAGTIANYMIADMERALMQDVTRGGLAVDTILESDETAIGYPSADWVAVGHLVTINYRTLLTDPNLAK